MSLFFSNLDYQFFILQLMFFESLFNDCICSTADLNSIKASISEDAYSYAAYLDGKEIVSKAHSVWHDGYFEIYGLGDILKYYLTPNAVFGRCHLEIFSEDMSGGTSVDFFVVPSNFEFEGFDGYFKFLSVEQMAVCPPNVQFVISALGPDLKGESPDIQPDLSSLPDDTLISAYIKNGYAKISFVTPPEPGVYNISLGSRVFTLFVTNIEDCHCIRYLNHFNCEEFLYLRADVKVMPQRTSQSASILGINTEYDIKSESKIEFSAKGIQNSSYQKILYFPYSNFFSIDGIRVSIPELKCEHSRESKDGYELKFSATLMNNVIPADPFKPDFRTFQKQFNHSFS